MTTLGLLAACDAAVVEPRAPTVLGTSVEGASVAPTDEITVRLSAAVDSSSVDNVVLVRGSVPRALAKALGHGPPSPDPRGAVVAVRAAVDGPLVRLTPRRALAPESRYTLVVG